MPMEKAYKTNVHQLSYAAIKNVRFGKKLGK